MNSGARTAYRARSQQSGAEGGLGAVKDQSYYNIHTISCNHVGRSSARNESNESKIEGGGALSALSALARKEAARALRGIRAVSVLIDQGCHRCAALEEHSLSAHVGKSGVLIFRAATIFLN